MPDGPLEVSSEGRVGGEARAVSTARLLKAEVAWIMLKCDGPVNAESWGLPAATVRAAERARDIAGDEFRELTDEIASCTEVAARQSDIGGLLALAEESSDRLLTLYARALGRLTVTAEEVERALGLEPIRFEDSD